MTFQKQLMIFLISVLTLQTDVAVTGMVVNKDGVYNMHQNSVQNIKTVECDVIIAGGSTASLGAAIAAARINTDNVICLTEPTDWLGGQMTSSGVSAIDFGEYNRLPQFQSKAFADMMASLGEGNPGRCWVSIKCFQPLNLIHDWINKTVGALPNLKIFFNTVIKRVEKADRIILGVTGIQRDPKPGFRPWKTRLSEIITDWYTEEDSEFFSKQTINFVTRAPKTHPVIIEATEYGDVLALSGASYRIGLEYPDETSNTTSQSCGQCITFPFFMVSTNDSAPEQDVPDPGGLFSFNELTFGRIWSYRRAQKLDCLKFHIFEIPEEVLDLMDFS